MFLCRQKEMLLRGFLARMWILLVVCLTLSVAASSQRCPDGLECEGSHTCCRRPGGDGYACCNQPQFPGVSLRMLPPNFLNEDSGVTCPDGSLCPQEYSCLRTPDASYGCCPWGEAISCADGRHCCPRGSHCSADGRSCFQTQDFIPPATLDAVQCPDGESQCPNESTCCLMTDGSWGCCPIPQASCCADKIHCCPHATTCDTAHSRCLSASGEEPLRTKFPARKRASVLVLPQKSICPNNESTCPDVATCCLLATGQYGCCPLQNAVCCSDHLHCCPQGTACDLTHSKCTLTPRWSWPITRLLVDLQKAHYVQCDAKHKCPDGHTCCRKRSGDWGCCPLEEAVCCSDHIHCCPKGYTCDLAEGACHKGIKSIPWLAKSSASIVHIAATSAGSVVPCDPQTSCPDQQTCCRLPTGAWGCCPLPKAVCCSDHLHCCPSGFHCGSEAGTCVKDGESIPWLEKRPAIVHVASSSMDVRCDDRVSCPDGQTCCRQASGEWGCCPFAQAVCCSDHVHCCPNGYTCDTAHELCNKLQHFLPWGFKRPADPPRSHDVPCNDTASCEEGQTCCKSVAGTWSCCQLPNAVCCEDHRHCCPSGYTCNLKAQTCEKRQPQSLAAEGVQSSVPLSPSRAATSGRDVPCDAQHYCHDGQTCCMTSSSGWACCPYKKGSCCSDKRHCCPSGFRCSRSGLQCLRNGPLRWDVDIFSSHSTQALPLL
ncbi:progranulin [Eublepharis macularius]|uniref:Progranulin n=1 Tax=Eublepharis macularius TaxID=481883 RepID=A0AA97K753_EUBMA|nr:progranulin [Eublepharis macularius]